MDALHCRCVYWGWRGGGGGGACLSVGGCYARHSEGRRGRQLKQRKRFCGRATHGRKRSATFIQPPLNLVTFSSLTP